MLVIVEWLDDEDPARAGIIDQALFVGLAASALTIGFNAALFVTLRLLADDSDISAPALVVVPALIVSFVIGPILATVGLLLWNRGRRTERPGLRSRVALFLCLSGFLGGLFWLGALGLGSVR
jgi:hypothetical protein